MPSKAPKVEKFPKSMGACADLIFDIRAERLAVQKQVDALEAREKALKEYIINNLGKSDTGAVGHHHKVVVVRKSVPQVVDWDKFYGYLKKSGSFDLMQKRLSAPAIVERWEAKKTVPGVEAFTVVDVSVTKI